MCKDIRDSTSEFLQLEIPNATGRSDKDSAGVGTEAHCCQSPQSIVQSGTTEVKYSWERVGGGGLGEWHRLPNKIPS